MNENEKTQRNAEKTNAHEIGSSNLQEFLRLFDIYRAVYERLQKERPISTSRGTRRNTSRPRAKYDLESILRRNGMERLIPRIRRNAPDAEKLLTEALQLDNENSRIEALCKIPGVGPSLASIVLAFISPENYAILNYRTWNALNYLGFNVPTKGNNGDLKVSELSQYFGIVGKLAKRINTTPREVDKALHALHKVNTTEKWRRLFNSMMLGIEGSHGLIDLTSPPNSTRFTLKSVLRPLLSGRKRRLDQAFRHE